MVQFDNILIVQFDNILVAPKYFTTRRQFNWNSSEVQPILYYDSNILDALIVHHFYYSLGAYLHHLYKLGQIKLAALP